MNILYMRYSVRIVYSDYRLWLNSGYNNQLREMWQKYAEQNFKMQYLWKIFWFKGRAKTSQRQETQNIGFKDEGRNNWTCCIEFSQKKPYTLVR